jgi:uncharacterized membrane protein YebE (DUF533 family)
MTRHHPFLHPFGWGSLAGGMLIALVGKLSSSEIGALAWTYGVLVVLGAAYLLIGLHVYAAYRARQEARSEAGRPVSRTEVSEA